MQATESLLVPGELCWLEKVYSILQATCLVRPSCLMSAEWSTCHPGMSYPAVTVKAFCSMLLVSPHAYICLCFASPEMRPLWEPVQTARLSFQICLSVIQSSRSRKQEIMGLPHCCAPCGTKISPLHAEGRGTDWETSRSRPDLRPISSAKCPGSGWRDSRPCSADNQHPRAQPPGQTEPVNHLGRKQCKFTFSKLPGWGLKHIAFFPPHGSQSVVCIA